MTTYRIWLTILL